MMWMLFLQKKSQIKVFLQNKQCWRVQAKANPLLIAMRVKIWLKADCVNICVYFHSVILIFNSIFKLKSLRLKSHWRRRDLTDLTCLDLFKFQTKTNFWDFDFWLNTFILILRKFEWVMVWTASFLLFSTANIFIDN